MKRPAQWWVKVISAFLAALAGTYGVSTIDRPNELVQHLPNAG